MAQAPPRCANHPAATAVARCKQCRKALCQKCVKKLPGGVYCSDECYQKMGALQERVQKADEGKRRSLRVGSLIIKLVIVAIAVGVLYYIFGVEGVRSISDFTELVKGLLP